MTAQSVSPLIHCICDDEKEKIDLRKKVSLAGKMLRSLEMNRGFEELPSGQEEIVHISVPADKYCNNHNYRKEFETAWPVSRTEKSLGTNGTAETSFHLLKGRTIKPVTR